MTRSKVKSRSHHDIAHLQPPTNVPTRYQLPTPYVQFPRYNRTKFYRSTSLQLCQRPTQGPYQVSTSYILWFPRYSPDKVFKLNFTVTRSKVKSRSHHDIAHLHPLTNVPIKYQLPTPYGFRDTARTNFFPLPIHPNTCLPIRIPWIKTTSHITSTYRHILLYNIKCGENSCTVCYLLLKKCFNRLLEILL